jgi:hypothetical protein
MGRCTVCGHETDQSFTVTTTEGRNFIFDSFECAIDRLAPRCACCGIRIIGHATVSDGSLFCGVHCSQLLGINSFV